MGKKNRQQNLIVYSWVKRIDKDHRFFTDIRKKYTLNITG